MALLALFGLVVAVVVVTLILLLLGVWSPYWVASGVARRLDRREGSVPASAGRALDLRAERRHATARARAWLRNVNQRF
ncbi:MAG: hypothetical protein QOK42_2314 [Frankiaceae bacterium]|jgi:hypothetical protein|nr:hypothetical protein [Frankiaceae bacterium]MDX6224101.1 hypothetical protein [Frankiales bacterium]MDX6272875.1 hypothetical protein [Frankiales bacterium]